MLIENPQIDTFPKKSIKKTIAFVLIVLSTSFGNGKSSLYRNRWFRFNIDKLGGLFYTNGWVIDKIIFRKSRAIFICIEYFGKTRTKAAKFFFKRYLISPKAFSFGSCELASFSYVRLSGDIQ